MRFTCPVCAYSCMEATARNYEICPCCGTEFGNDDEFLTHEQLRAQWIRNGLQWFFRKPPTNWNPWYQLIEGNHLESIPFRALVEANIGETQSTAEDVHIKLRPALA